MGRGRCPAARNWHRERHPASAQASAAEVSAPTGTGIPATSPSAEAWPRPRHHHRQRDRHACPPLGGISLSPDPACGHEQGQAEASAKVAVLDRAANWVATQVGRAGLISCDKAMCQALEARQVPAADLLVLRSGVADPLHSAVVVVTAAVKKMVGSRRLAADAPAAIASFGSGAAQISIRLIFRRGAAAYAAALRRDIADRKLAGTSFVLLDSRVARRRPSARSSEAARSTRVSC